jgi:hypothetical protein
MKELRTATKPDNDNESDSEHSDSDADDNGEMSLWYQHSIARQTREMYDWHTAREKKDRQKQIEADQKSTGELNKERVVEINLQIYALKREMTGLLAKLSPRAAPSSTTKT